MREFEFWYEDEEGEFDEDVIDDLAGLFTGWCTEERFLFDFLTAVEVGDLSRLVEVGI